MKENNTEKSCGFLRVVIRIEQRLLLSQIFAQVQSNCDDNNKTLYDVSVRRVHTQELQANLQNFKYQYTNQYATDLTDTTVGGYAADGTSCDCFQFITETGSSRSAGSRPERTG